ncbi:hypothetical protein CHU98_g10271 [Xylaria longipes]|nr:hypothetical protein CHU98_g10271 [Xylaria longipes]
MPGSRLIIDSKGRCTTIPANCSQEKIEMKVREFLISCDIRDSTTATFGGSEYSNDALARAHAARANYSVKRVAGENGSYIASWH